MQPCKVALKGKIPRRHAVGSRDSVQRKTGLSKTRFTNCRLKIRLRSIITLMKAEQLLFHPAPALDRMFLSMGETAQLMWTNPLTSSEEDTETYLKYDHVSGPLSSTFTKSKLSETCPKLNSSFASFFPLILHAFLQMLGLSQKNFFHTV